MKDEQVLEPEVVLRKMPWKCLDCGRKWEDRADGRGVAARGCPDCGSHRVLDCNVIVPLKRSWIIPDQSLVQPSREADYAEPSFVDDKMRDDNNYAPYCMRCRGLQRMRRVLPTLAECPVCPAVHEIQNA